MGKPTIQEQTNEINNYEQTVHAILGFMNVYRYDRKTLRENVRVFQGRRLTTSTGERVAPDVGVSTGGADSVLGEVKLTFPKDQTHWLDDFLQLMRYDAHLEGWPTQTGLVPGHDVVLITHHTRAVDVADYFLAQAEDGVVTFERPFCILECVRSEQGKDFFTFRTQYGAVSDAGRAEGFRRGISISITDVYDTLYATVKLYDARPPDAYLAFLIWSEIVTPRATAPPWRGRTGVRVEVDLKIAEIADELAAGFSFSQLCGSDRRGQPEVPRREWCVDACQVLVKGGLARWLAQDKEVRFIYRRLGKDVLAYMKRICAGMAKPHEQSDWAGDAPQLSLFTDSPT